MNYPKMLYTGDKVKYEYAIANDEAHEEVLKTEGFIDYVDLNDEPEPELHSIGDSTPDDSAQKLNEALDEIERLNKIIDAGVQENAELRAQLEALNAPAETEVEQVNYSDMTSDELRALLDEKGIKYLARDSKDTLIKLLG